LQARGFLEDVGKGGHHAGPQGKPGEFRDWTFFCTIRHPGDALLTWYFKSGPPNGYGEFGVRWFEEWLPKIGYVKCGGKDWRLFDWHAQRSEVWLRYEELQEQLDLLLETHGIEPVVLKPANVTAQKVLARWWDFYDPATRACLERYFGQEMEDYGYTWPGEED
jgi:hypothetical protein